MQLYSVDNAILTYKNDANYKFLVYLFSLI